MSDELSLKVKNAIQESLDLKKLVLHQKLYKILVEMGQLIVQSILNGGKVLICGNGGSAADAQHLTAEFLIRLTSEVNREGIPAISLAVFKTCTIFSDFPDVDITNKISSGLARVCRFLLNKSLGSKSLIAAVKVEESCSKEIAGIPSLLTSEVSLIKNSAVKC